MSPEKSAILKKKQSKRATRLKRKLELQGLTSFQELDPLREKQCRPSTSLNSYNPASNSSSQVDNEIQFTSRNWSESGMIDRVDLPDTPGSPSHESCTNFQHDKVDDEEDKDVEEGRKDRQIIIPSPKVKSGNTSDFSSDDDLPLKFYFDKSKKIKFTEIERINEPTPVNTIPATYCNNHNIKKDGEVSDIEEEIQQTFVSPHNKDIVNHTSELLNSSNQYTHCMTSNYESNPVDEVTVSSDDEIISEKSSEYSNIDDQDVKFGDTEPVSMDKVCYCNEELKSSFKKEDVEDSNGHLKDTDMDHESSSDDEDKPLVIDEPIEPANNSINHQAIDDVASHNIGNFAEANTEDLFINLADVDNTSKVVSRHSTCSFREDGEFISNGEYDDDDDDRSSSRWHYDTKIDSDRYQSGKLTEMNWKCTQNDKLTDNDDLLSDHDGECNHHDRECSDDDRECNGVCSDDDGEFCDSECTNDDGECSDDDGEYSDNDRECSDDDGECSDSEYTNDDGECSDNDRECSDDDGECSDDDRECTDHYNECCDIDEELTDDDSNDEDSTDNKMRRDLEMVCFPMDKCDQFQYRLLILI